MPDHDRGHDRVSIWAYVSLLGHMLVSYGTEALPSFVGSSVDSWLFWPIIRIWILVGARFSSLHVLYLVNLRHAGCEIV